MHANAYTSIPYVCRSYKGMEKQSVSEATTHLQMHLGFCGCLADVRVYLSTLLSPSTLDASQHPSYNIRLLAAELFVSPCSSCRIRQDPQVIDEGPAKIQSEDL